MKNRLSLNNIISLLTMLALGMMACALPPHLEPTPQPDPEPTMQFQLFSAIEAGDAEKVIAMGKKHPVELETAFAYKKHPIMTALQYAIAIKRYDIAEKILASFDIRKLNPWHRVNGDNVIETVLKMPKTEKLHGWVSNFIKSGDVEQVKYLLSDPETIHVLKKDKEVWTKVEDRGLEAKEDEESSTGTIKPIGIENSGNHCYADAAMQVLMLMPAEYWEAAEIKYRAADAIAKGVVLKDQEFLAGVFDFRKAWISGNARPASLKDKLDSIIKYGVDKDIYYSFKGYNAQEDAQEFLIAITGRLGDASFPHFKEVSTLERAGAKPSKTINGLASGLDLRLFDAKQNKLPNGTALKEVVDIHFAKGPVKVKDDKGVEVDATKTFSLEGEADYLFVTLSRFLVDPVSKKKEKIKTEIEFADGIIDLTTYSKSKEKPKFSLIGATLHSGSTEGGHYIAYVKYGDQWYEANDSSISKKSWEQVKSTAASGATVMLFKRIKE